jgi:hypothetical protein
MKKLPLLLLLASVCLSAEGCKTRKKSKKDPVIPTVVGNPVPPPQEPPSNPDNPNNPVPKPSPIPNPDKPSPNPTPTPTPSDPNNPVPTPAPLPKDRWDKPIIPTAPVVTLPHVVLNTGVVQVYRTEVTVHACADRAVYAYFVPCDNALYCWDWKPAPTCGYFICQRWGW